MTHTSNIRLRVLFGKDDAHKMILSNGLPSSLHDMVEEVKKTFNLKENVRLQYMDPDFGEFVNVTTTSEIQHLGTIKVIQQQEEIFPMQDLGSPGTSGITMDMDESTSEMSYDADSTETSNVSQPGTVMSRTNPWPQRFPIPSFSYETELQL